MSVCLMSIKPKWAKEIYSGKKTVEFRKSSPAVGSLVFLYESTPVRAVTANTLKCVWKSGTVKRDDLFEYAGGADGKCCAILADDPWRFPEELWPKLEKYSVRPPQSWQTLRGNHFGENALARTLLHLLKTAISNEVPK